MNLMQTSANNLTKHELDFISDKEYPLIKKSAMQKISTLFEEMGEQMKADETLNAFFTKRTFKVSRGDNYLHLPYVVLDYPKISRAHFELHCRTMFWWGNYFSMNVFIKTSKIDITSFYKNLSENTAAGQNVMVLTAENIWNQDLNAGEFINSNNIDKKVLDVLAGNPYQKISAIHDIKRSAELSEAAGMFYKKVLGCMKKI